MRKLIVLLSLIVILFFSNSASAQVMRNPCKNGRCYSFAKERVNESFDLNVDVQVVEIRKEKVKEMTFRRTGINRKIMPHARVIWQRLF